MRRGYPFAGLPVGPFRSTYLIAITDIRLTGKRANRQTK